MSTNDENSFSIIISLEAESINTPSKRQSVAREIYDKKLLSTLTDAVRFVDCAWDHSQGVKLAPALAGWFEARKSLIDQFNLVQEQQSAAFREQELIDQKRSKRTRLELTVAQLEDIRNRVTLVLGSVCPPPSRAGDIFAELLERGKAVAGAKESIRMADDALETAKAELAGIVKDLAPYDRPDPIAV